MKNFKILELEEDWAELGPKFCVLRQSWTKKSSKTGEEKKGLVSASPYFLTAIGKV